MTALAGGELIDQLAIERYRVLEPHLADGIPLADLARTGTLTGVIVDWNTEPYADISIERPEFPAMFPGKSIRDKFVAGEDVDIMSRATITVRAAAREIRDASRMVARAVLKPDAVRKPAPTRGR